MNANKENTNSDLNIFEARRHSCLFGNHLNLDATAIIFKGIVTNFLDSPLDKTSGLQPTSQQIMLVPL